MRAMFWWVVAVECLWGAHCGAAAFPGSIILGRPTATSVTVSLMAVTDQEAYLEHGVSEGVYTEVTAPLVLRGGIPGEVSLTGLRPSSRHYYRVRFRSPGVGTFAAGWDRSFQTQRRPGESFLFEVQGDSHPERRQQFLAELYTNTLLHAAADRPDFYLCIGDDFSVDTIPVGTISQPLVAERYQLQRPFLGLVADAAHLFLVNGNHEQAARYLLNGTPDNVAVWAGNARKLYYPQPSPDGFYTGDTETVPFVGLLHDYYAWTWGDALFVTLDPYWHSDGPVDNVYGGAAKRTNWWDITLGEVQYRWLKGTLEGSKARYKFVFTHHVLGSGRGGTDEAHLYEWGGENGNGSWGFTANRPGWPLPIHQLMAANNVTIFFQGHDHIFVKQQLDGVVYQSLPEPADPGYALYNADAYESEYETNNTGRVRVQVSPDRVQVEYVRSWLPADEGPGRTNNAVDHRYVVFPLTVAGTEREPLNPGSVDGVWVRSQLEAAVPLRVVNLVVMYGGRTNVLSMVDDGLHQDGAAGDGVYGAQIPALPDGTPVRYYVWAEDVSGRRVVDPAGAPVAASVSAYTVGVVGEVGDGIPNVWRSLRFGGEVGTTNAISCALCDPDGDGVDNLHEYLADTDPMRSGSRLVLGVQASGNGVRLEAETSRDRRYTLERATDLVRGDWEVVPGFVRLPGTGSMVTFQDAAVGGGARFYRLVVAFP